MNGKQNSYCSLDSHHHLAQSMTQLMSHLYICDLKQCQCDTAAACVALELVAANACSAIYCWPANKANIFLQFLELTAV